MADVRPEDYGAVPVGGPKPEDFGAVPINTTPTTQEGFLKSVGDTLSNIPSSAVGVAKGIYQAISHPVDTAKGVVDIGAGALQAAFAPESFKKSGNPALYSPEAEKAFDSAVQFYKNRYGSWDNFLASVKKDPVSVAMDLSAVGGVLGKVATVGKLAPVGEAVSKAAATIDPIAQTAKAVGAVAKPVYEYGAGITTGAGATAIKQAIKGGDAFTQAMRGKISESDVLDTAKESLQAIKDQRGAAYREQLGKLKANANQMDIGDLKVGADNWLDKFGIAKTKDGLDFSRSPLRNNAAAQKEVTDVYETIKDWGSKSGDTTPAGLDTLKRVINDSYTSTSQSRAMVSSLASMVKAKIVKEVPEYASMTKNYEEMSGLIKDIEQGLSLKNRAATDTALRKLMTATREDSTFRRSLIEELDKRAGKDVAGAVAGLLLKNPWSNRLGSMGHLYATGTAAAYTHNPALAALLPLASPRVMGEVSLGLGKAGSVLPYTSPLYQGAYQAGRLSENQ